MVIVTDTNVSCVLMTFKVNIKSEKFTMQIGYTKEWSLKIVGEENF